MSVFEMSLYTKQSEDLIYTLHVQLEKQNGNPDTWTVTGDIVEKGTSNALSDVKVTFNGNSITTLTDGKFTFNDVLPGAYPISLEKVGYNTHTETITLGS
jgi:hypothetical protein